MLRLARRERSVAPIEAKLDAIVLGPALDFMRSLWRLNHALELTSGHMERSIGITAQQRMVIRCIGKCPGLTPTQLAMLLHVDRSTISTALNRMERDGLVVRRSDEKDRRSVTLWLSTKGKRHDRPSQETLESAVERLLTKTGNRDLLATKRVMVCLSERLESVLEHARSRSVPAPPRRGKLRTR